MPPSGVSGLYLQTYKLSNTATWRQGGFSPCCYMLGLGLWDTMWCCGNLRSICMQTDQALVQPSTAAMRFKAALIAVKWKTNQHECQTQMGQWAFRGPQNYQRKYSNIRYFFQSAACDQYKTFSCHGQISVWPASKCTRLQNTFNVPPLINSSQNISYFDPRAT